MSFILCIIKKKTSDKFYSLSIVLSQCFARCENSSEKKGFGIAPIDNKISYICCGSTIVTVTWWSGVHTKRHLLILSVLQQRFPYLSTHNLTPVLIRPSKRYPYQLPLRQNPKLTKMKSRNIIKKIISHNRNAKANSDSMPPKSLLSQFNSGFQSSDCSQCRDISSFPGSCLNLCPK